MKGSVADPSWPRLGVLISGRGSNMSSLIAAAADSRLRATIAVVLSNRPDAPGLERAREAGVDTVVVNHRDYAAREDFDAAVAGELVRRRVSLVCLAGFMRLVGGPLLAAFPQAILNIHPSLLPAFPGVDAQRQALEHGVRVSGVTVHLVTRELDGGPIVAQTAVPVMPGDTVESLSARILEQEHRIYPEAVSIVLGGQWRVEGRRFIVHPESAESAG